MGRCTCYTKKKEVADALNLSLHIIESNPRFASVTNISPVRATVINIGHLDEIH